MSKATPINCIRCGQLIGKARPVEDLFDPSELRAMSVEAANEYVASIAKQVIALKAENKRLRHALEHIAHCQCSMKRVTIDSYGHHLATIALQALPE